MKKFCMCLCASLLLVMPVVSLGVDIDAWKEVKKISTDDLKKLYDSKEDFLLINTLSPIEYAEEHIGGSVNIPYMYLKSGKAKLPDDKNKMLVFYCKGVKWTKSVKTASLAVKMGYRKVYVYNEGLPEWTKRGYPVDADTVYPKIQVPAVSASVLNDRLKREENIFILDIRDENDRKAGWIKGSTHIDMEILTDKVKDIPKSKSIVIVDLHGKQGQTSARYLVSKGFKDITVLEGGFMEGWANGNYPVEK